GGGAGGGGGAATRGGGGAGGGGGGPADLVHRLVDRERLAGAEVRRGERGQRRFGRRAPRLAEPLQADQQRDGRPAAGEREQRHGDQVGRVAGDGQRPVALGAVGERAADVAQAVADRLAGPGDHADRGGPCAQRGER